MIINWGPMSEWVLVVLITLDSLAYYIFEYKKGKGNDKGN